MERELPKREIVYYRHYYLEFYARQNRSVKKKPDWTLKLIGALDFVPEKYFKHLAGSKGIYEIRVEVGSDIFRLFSFFDKGRLVVLLNGFQKKSQKAPANEIDLALKLRKQYYDDKEND